MKKVLTVLFVALTFLATRPSSVQTQSPRGEFVPGEVVVQFRANATAADEDDARGWVGGQRRQLLRRRNGNGDLEVTRHPGRSVEEAVALLRQHPAVQTVEPNWVYRHQDTSDDQYYTTGLLWGMYGDATAPANQFGSQAGEAWTAGKIGSSSVYVGVVDEGIDFSHPDLAANIWTNPFDPVDGADNDGNGYIDDVHGWDFVANDNSVYDGASGNSVDAHGTHVSGTIGGKGGNAQGVAGVNWNVTIISAKFLGPSGGTLANAIKAVDYITDLKTRHGLKIVATNNSWGGGGFSQGLLDAIVRAAKQNILFVAAAGNSNVNNDTTASYPSNYNTTAGAGYDGVIAVAAITSTGARASFSSYGQTTVDLGAPGSGVYSTTPNNTYSSYSGTSMATPHVTGAAALYASMNPSASALAIKNAILASAVATPTASLNGITVTNGRLNIGQFGGLPPPSPPSIAPSTLVATAVSTSQINLTWTQTSPDETGFEIHRCQGTGCTNFALIGSVGANVTSFNNTGLSANTLYRYEVRAFNTGGPSGFSNIAQATTLAPPAPPVVPSGLTATAASTSQINLAWTQTSTNETGFEIQRCQGANCTNFALIGSVGVNATTFNNTGLSANTLYRYRVRAVNTNGPSGFSNIAQATTLAPPAPPAAPSALTATPGASRTINLAWKDNSGSSESGFKIERCQGSNCSGFSQIAQTGANVTTYQDSDKTRNRVYRYRVRAFNATGNSGYSNIASATAP